MQRGRLPALDGVRGLAILLVVGYHARVPGFGGGATGVNVFFVLSGFLITTILLKQGSLRGPGLARFYVRRALRLVPALTLVVAFCVVYALVVLEGGERAFLLKESATSITYTTDFYLGRGSSTADFGLLGHTWSLAVEEQFYVVWPFVLIAILRATDSVTRRTAITLAFAAAFALWRAFLTTQGADAHVGLNVDAKGDLLLVGCALALVLPAAQELVAEKLQSALTVWAIAGVGVVLIISTGRVHPPLGTGYVFVALASAGLIARLVVPTDGGRAQRRLLTAFSSAPIVYLGAISYSLYLWHVVIFGIFRDDLGVTTSSARVVFGPLILAITIGVASFSRHVVEEPFLRRKRQYEEPDRAPEAAPTAVTREPAVQAT